MNHPDSETRKGYAIEIVQDMDAECPWTAWDGCADILVNYDGRITQHGNTAPELPSLTAEIIKSRAADICTLTDCRSLLQLSSRADRYNYSDAADCINDALTYWFEDQSRTDQLESLAAVFNMLPDHAAMTGASTGYCQGDYAEVLAVFTPEFAELTGCKLEDSSAILTGAIELYSAWAWGDVYGYDVTNPAGDDIDSCWGFYGRDMEKNGALEAAREAVDRDRAERLKELKAERETLATMRENAPYLMACYI